MDDRIVALARERYISLTTYRRDGRAVATPVWFVLEGARILVWTDAASGKAKRIRANGRAAVAASDARGRTKAAAIDATARVLPASEDARSRRLLTGKYRLLKPLVDLWSSVGLIRTQKETVGRGVPVDHTGLSCAGLVCSRGGAWSPSKRMSASSEPATRV